jgi:D-lyxose ketol-isomerase
MPTYRYTHVYDAIFPDLQHGINAEVKGAAEELHGSTVVLHQGDEITLPEPREHAFWEEVGAAAPKTPELKDKPEPKPAEPTE